MNGWLDRVDLRPIYGRLGHPGADALEAAEGCSDSSPAGITSAPQAIQRFVERTTRLYEQDADVYRIELCARQWQHEATDGVLLAG